MQIFQDADSREWTAQINYAALARVKARTGTDLLTVLDEGSPLVDRLLTDEVLCSEIAWAVIAPQAELRGISQDAFFESIDGEAAATLQGLVMQGLIDFFPHAASQGARKTRSLTAASLALWSASELSGNVPALSA